MADQDSSNPDKNKQLDEVIKALKSLDKSLSFLKDFEKKKDKKQTVGSRFDKKKQIEFLDAVNSTNKKAELKQRWDSKFQTEQRKLAWKQFQ